MSTCTAGGAHHWLLETPQESVTPEDHLVRGTCKKCELTRDDFPASSTLDWLESPVTTGQRKDADMKQAQSRRRYKQRDITLSPSQRGTYVGAAES